MFEFPEIFLTKKHDTDISVTLLNEKTFPAWLKKQLGHVQTSAEQTGFAGKPKQTLIIRNEDGEALAVAVGVHTPCSLYDLSCAVQNIQQSLSHELINECSFSFDAAALKEKDALNACIGWGLACYQFTTYKENKTPLPKLVWPKGVERKHVLAHLESLFGLRNLINTPANDLGPEELEAVTKDIAKHFEAKIKVIRGERLEKDFPLIHAVGDGAEESRRPRLLDLTWGNEKKPKLTIVGKGVTFDTGGLNLKPGKFMALMKKDMGGAAHALALGYMIMALKLPVRLRILIPAVENSVSGASFRPGDVLQSRKGITVENTNTDAEGRLIVADALTYGCEDKPDLIVDYTTLTGSARAALGPDIPAFFFNSEKLAEKLKKISFKSEDPLWPMPLWAPYKKHIESPIADLVNSATLPGDLIYSALFLEQFLTGTPDWLHLDIYAWEQSGKPGRPRGGADTGLRSVLAFIEERYGR